MVNLLLNSGASLLNGKPIIFLTQWKMMGNSVIHNLPYSDIPHGYKKCKYIESHGTEYIDLGYKSLYSYELKAQLVEAKSTFCIILANGGSAGQFLGFGADSKWTLGSTFVFNTDNSSPAVVQVTFSASGVEATINNENISRSGTSANSNFKLFTHTTVSTTYNSKAKLWYLKAYDGNTLVHHWIPCLDDNDVPCLYDLIGGQTYYNGGEGTLGYEIEPQPAEIWSCGEYSEVDNKWHIRILPEGYGVIDIALDEPLRKVNDVADTIEFADGVATLTRYLGNMNWQNASIRKGTSPVIQFQVNCSTLKMKSNNILSSRYPTKSYIDSASTFGGFGIAGYSNSPLFRVVDEEYDSLSAEEFLDNVLSDTALIYELATPTTEVIQVPQIQEADSYSCVISQGAKAVEWSSFETE